MAKVRNMNFVIFVTKDTSSLVKIPSLELITSNILASLAALVSTTDPVFLMITS